jgi:hypothetical protein
MKLPLFLIIISVYSSFSQKCNVDNNPVPVLKDRLFKNSVNYKDVIYFYSPSIKSDSLLVRLVLLDVFSRTVEVGDSATIFLKNKYKIKLNNAKQSISRSENYNLIFVDIPLYPTTLTGWISKSDVKELSQNNVKKIFIYAPINEDLSQKKKSKMEKKYQDYAEMNGGFAWKKNMKKLANCALNL